MSHVDLDHAVGYALKRAATSLRTAMDAALRERGLSVPQYACLELLSQRPGASYAELARGAFVTRQAMHQLLAGLRSEGLVRTTGTGKASRHSLTAAGRQRVASAAALVADIEERMLSGLQPRERERLRASLDACTRALDEAPAPSPSPSP